MLKDWPLEDYAVVQALPTRLQCGAGFCSRGRHNMTMSLISLAHYILNPGIGYSLLKNAASLLSLALWLKVDK